MKKDISDKVDKKNDTDIVDWYKQWWFKVDVIKGQIEKIEKLNNYTIFSLSSFILKTLLIEFELKQFLSRLELYISTHNDSEIVHIRSRTPKDFDDDKFTLGRLTKELSKYEGKLFMNLNKNLEILKSKRNKYIHKLFNPGNIVDMHDELLNGIKLTNTIIKEISEINSKLSIIP
ncbi:MAG: hypothetical protein PHH01_03090 [Patescibacteria group bacterium]|nr:hypothetical protein [Patescibacteria group bacterium]